MQLMEYNYRGVGLWLATIPHALKTITFNIWHTQLANSVKITETRVIWRS
jgi:hypothetical protein